VVITAHSGVRIAVAAMQAGACDFVMKPWRNADLLARIDAAIARAPKTRPRPAPSRRGTGASAGRKPCHRTHARLIRRIGPTQASVAVTGPADPDGRWWPGRFTRHRAGRPPVGIDLEDPTAWDRLAEGETLILRHADRLPPVMQGRLLEQIAPGARVMAIMESTAPLTAPCAHGSPPSRSPFRRWSNAGTTR
jgi:hypothetical protein